MLQNLEQKLEFMEKIFLPLHVLYLNINMSFKCSMFMIFLLKCKHLLGLHTQNHDNIYLELMVLMSQGKCSGECGYLNGQQRLEDNCCAENVEHTETNHFFCNFLEKLAS